MGVKISKAVEAKLLDKHGVTRKEVIECFTNMERAPLKDLREEHDTVPPTLWMISETNHRRRLKVIFMVKDGDAEVKSAYEPEEEAQYIFRTRAPSLF
jgi:hypothetical protein